MGQARDLLEHRQITIYFCAIIAAAAFAWFLPGTSRMEGFINPALALMLYVTFLQVPMAQLRQALGNMRFLSALLIANFVVIPALVAALLQMAPHDPMIRLGVLFVLLTPCIDYVVTFAHLGRADARLLLAATPSLLIVQMLLLPAYLRLFLGADAAGLVAPGPFIHAFVWLIALPLILAALTQYWAGRRPLATRIANGLGLLPVPATALVLFIVIAAVMPQIGSTIDTALRVIPIYVAFAVLAPALGWCVARRFNLQSPAARAVAFSSGTRNSLVVLPLALAVPGAMPILPVVIVTQTLVELVSQLVYVRIMPRLGRG
ncbi:arsenic resistance protein [Alcaligenaceae bacterium C4P045]|nr:arsenic resistance protein [Alcaligenaceae bacterium C4P045]